MANNTTTEKLLTAKAVGEMLSLSKRAVFRMRSAGLIVAPVKVGQGAIRWRKSDIEKWIRMGCPDREEFEMFAKMAERGKHE